MKVKFMLDDLTELYTGSSWTVYYLIFNSLSNNFERSWTLYWMTFNLIELPTGWFLLSWTVYCIIAELNIEWLSNFRVELQDDF